MSATHIEARVTVARDIYNSLPKRPDRIRECVQAATAAMNREAATAGRVVSETPALVDQRDTGLGYIELTFQAPTTKR